MLVTTQGTFRVTILVTSLVTLYSREITPLGNETDTSIYSNTLQVLGTETHILNPDGDLSNTSFVTPITTAPVGTKAIIVTGGIGTNSSRYTKFSGCVFNTGFPNDVTLTEVASLLTLTQNILLIRLYTVGILEII